MSSARTAKALPPFSRGTFRITRAFFLFPCLRRFRNRNLRCFGWIVKGRANVVELGDLLNGPRHIIVLTVMGFCLIVLSIVLYLATWASDVFSVHTDFFQNVATTLARPVRRPTMFCRSASAGHSKNGATVHLSRATSAARTGAHIENGNL